jgi:hypothetical protein
MLPEGNVSDLTFRNRLSRDCEGLGDKDQFKLPSRATIRYDRLIYNVVIKNALRPIRLRGKYRFLPLRNDAIVPRRRSGRFGGHG